MPTRFSASFQETVHKEMASKTSEDHSRDDGMEYPIQVSFEQESLLNHPHARWARKSQGTTFGKIMAVVNLVLGLNLAVSLGLVAHSTTKACPESVAQIVDPWCQLNPVLPRPFGTRLTGTSIAPALTAVVPVIKKFTPQLVFQSETSDIVEAAWKKSLGGICSCQKV